MASMPMSSDRSTRRVTASWARRGVVCLVALVLLVGCSRGESYAPPRTPRDSIGTTAEAAQQSLDVLAHAAAVDDPGATRRIQGRTSDLPAAMVQNAHLVGVTGLQLRYVDETDQPLGSSLDVRYGAHAWPADVQVTYRMPEDARATDFMTVFVFVRTHSGLPQIVATGGYGQRGALWLQRPVEVRRNADTLLIAATNQPLGRFWGLAKPAVHDVHTVLSGMSKPLVFEVPGNQGELEQNLDVATGTYNLIAGVTGSVDGSLARRAPLHSFFNPAQFAHLKHNGAQLVASHEATLQATDAPLTAMPLWVKEGFADYVALDHAHIPLHTEAHNISARTRRKGTPTALPGDEDFNPSDTDLKSLNAVYESAWLACRFIATSRGEAKLLELYADFDRGQRANSVFGHALGLSLPAFTAAWRRYLQQVSAAASARGR